FAECTADASRWFIFTVNAPGEAKPVSIDAIKQSFRKSLLPVWNMYNYLVTYANLAAFEQPEDAEQWLRENDKDLLELDRWLLARQAGMLQEVTAHYDSHDFQRAGRAVEEYI